MGEYNFQGLAYSHIHLTTVISPLAGPNKGQQYTLRSHKSIDYGNGAKSGAIDGPQMGPVQLYPGKAEPSFKVETSKREFNEIVAFFGPGFLTIPFDMTNTYQIPGDPAYTDYVDGCLNEEDGTKSATGDGVMVSLGGKCLLCWPNGYHPFDQTKPRRT